MNWSEHMIARALALQFFNRKYLVVVPNCNYTGHECDLLCVTENLRIIDVEIKISRSDLKADAKKEKWWHREQTGWTDVFTDKGVFRGRNPVYKNIIRDWPPKVWKHYYALPANIWTDDLLDCLPSPNSGVLLLKNAVIRYGSVIETNHAQIDVVCKRRATPKKDAKPIPADAAVDIARLASLRMWDSYLQVENSRREIARERYVDDGVRP